MKRRQALTYAVASALAAFVGIALVGTALGFGDPAGGEEASDAVMAELSTRQAAMLQEQADAALDEVAQLRDRALREAAVEVAMLRLAARRQVEAELAAHHAAAQEALAREIETQRDALQAALVAERDRAMAALNAEVSAYREQLLAAASRTSGAATQTISNDECAGKRGEALRRCLRNDDDDDDD